MFSDVQVDNVGSKLRIAVVAQPAQELVVSSLAEAECRVDQAKYSVKGCGDLLQGT